jgi:EpsI family protein
LSEHFESLEFNSRDFKPELSLSLALQGGLLLVCFFLLFGPTLPPLYKDWLEVKSFSHGLLVPFISGYLIWQRKRELAATPVHSSAWGVLLLVPAIVLALAGKAIGDAFSERVGMVLCLSGLVWLLFGWRIFKKVSFPLGYLLLMIPLPYVIVNEVAYQLRILDAAAAAPLLRLLGVPVYRDSYFLHLPDITLEVADLCSGISSVFSLFALGGAYVYFTPLRPAFKLIAVVSTFPFAVVINLLRIVLTAALSYHVSKAVLNMLIHELTGTITFFIALALFILLCEFLQRRFLGGLKASAKQPVDAAAGAADRRAVLRADQKPSSWLPLTIGLGMLLGAFYLASNVSAQLPTSPSMDLATMAPQVAGFQTNGSQGTGVYKDPGAELQLSRVYTSTVGSVEVYVGFRSTQLGEKRLKSPRLGFPYGWNYLWVEPATVPTAHGHTAVNGNWMLTQSSRDRVLVFYWYQVGDETFGGELEKRWIQARNSIFQGRSDGSVVRLATPVTDNETIDQAKGRLGAFVADLYPRLRQVLPQ